jgi:hypothetical protein
MFPLPHTLTDTAVNKEPVQNLWVDSSAEKVLVMRNSKVNWVVLEGDILVCNNYPRRFAKAPESAHYACVMIDVVSNGMCNVLGLRNKPSNRPTIPPVDETVCISDQHDIHVGFINRHEPANHIGFTQDACREQNDIGIRLQNLDVFGIYVGSGIDVDLPTRKVFLHELDIV